MIIRYWINKDYGGDEENALEEMGSYDELIVKVIEEMEHQEISPRDPIAWAASSMAKLVSFLMLMDPIGSITKPIFIVIDDGRTEFDL